MCLYTNKKFPKLSLKEKTVYKMIIKFNDFHWQPAYTLCPILKYGKSSNKLTPFISTGMKYPKKIRIVTKGYYHAFTNIDTAKERLRAYLINYPIASFKLKIVECKIPKFTFYFEDKKCSEIAAKTIIVPNPNK